MARSLATSVVVLAAALASACDSGNSPGPTIGPTAPTPPIAGPAAPGPNTHPLVGNYDLSVRLGDGCSAVPDAERTRTYHASIAYKEAGLYVVTLDGRFLTGAICTAAGGKYAGMGCHQFFASEDIDTANFFLENNNDEAHGAHIVEQLPSGRWLEIIGSASGPYDLRSGSATGTATAWYCPQDVPYPFPCRGFVSCTTDLRLTLTRR
jgi:hypothetical protein